MGGPFKVQSREPALALMAALGGEARPQRVAVTWSGRWLCAEGPLCLEGDGVGTRCPAPGVLCLHLHVTDCDTVLLGVSTTRCRFRKSSVQIPLQELTRGPSSPIACTRASPRPPRVWMEAGAMPGAGRRPGRTGGAIGVGEGQGRHSGDTGMMQWGQR